MKLQLDTAQKYYFLQESVVVYLKNTSEKFGIIQFDIAS